MTDVGKTDLVKGAKVALSDRAQHDARLAALESQTHYWLFRNNDGLIWVAAQGQAAARAAVGVVQKNFTLMFDHAGECLRVAMIRAAHWKTDIHNLKELVELAKSDPEPPNAVGDAWKKENGVA